MPRSTSPRRPNRSPATFRPSLRATASRKRAPGGNSAKQSCGADAGWIASAFALRASADAVVARAPRNDAERPGSFSHAIDARTSQRHCELLRSNPGLRKRAGLLRRKGSRNDGVGVRRQPRSVIACRTHLTPHALSLPPPQRFSDPRRTAHIRAPSPRRRAAAADRPGARSPAPWCRRQDRSGGRGIC
jgi:hypothetical protein